MQIRAAISQAHVNLLLEFLRSIDQKYVNVYHYGKNNDFLYGTDEFKNLVKDRHNGCDEEEMMELYSDISLWKIVKAVSYLLEREESI